MKNLLVLVALSLGLIIGCVSQKPKPKPAPKIIVKKVEKGPKLSAEDVVRVAFEAPVVGVDGTRSEKADDPFAVEKPKIIKEYKKNATHDIKITFETSDGEEKVLHGTIHVKDYKASKPELGEAGEIIGIEPDNNLAYEEIWRTGYGRMVAYEVSENRERGAEIVQLTLGSRKKKKVTE